MRRAALSLYCVSVTIPFVALKSPGLQGCQALTYLSTVSHSTGQLCFQAQNHRPDVRRCCCFCHLQEEG